MYRITCASRAGFARRDRLVTGGRAMLMYQIIGRYHVHGSESGRLSLVLIDVFAVRARVLGVEDQGLAQPA